MKTDPIDGFSVIIPALNEGGAIEPLLIKLKSVLANTKFPFEIIAVNDGSSDNTEEKIRSVTQVTCLTHSNPMGYGASLADGIQNAKYNSLIILDADGTYNPDEIPVLLEKYTPGTMVIGWRKKIHLPNAKLPKSFARRLLHFFARLLTGRSIEDLNSGFRIFPKSIWLKHRNAFPPGFSFTTTLTLLYHFYGLQLIYVPITYQIRIGSTKVQYFFDGLRVAAWMTRLTVFHKPSRLILPLLLLGGFLIRWIGMDYGLPSMAFPDEPHHINLAVYFGGGNLNPHIFKYPTLWMYTLFLLYGFEFAIGLMTGIFSGVKDFATLFIWDPTLFFLSARILTAFFTLIAGFFTYKAALVLYQSKKSALFAISVLMLSPPLILFGHQAKPDMMMLALCALAWWRGARYWKEGNKRDLFICGGSLGLACSTQYTAGILVPLIGLAYLLRRYTDKNVSWADFAISCFLIPLFFFIGTPFALIDYSTFLSDVRDVLGYGQGKLSAESARVGLRALHYYFEAVGLHVVGFVLMSFGVFTVHRSGKRVWLYLILPLTWGALVLGAQNTQAGVVNYSFSLYPGIALLMSAPLAMEYKKPKWNYLWMIIFSLLLIFPLYKSINIGKLFSQVDGRLQAKNWIETHVSPGTKILLDQPHMSPALVPTKDQVESLYEMTKESGHSRAEYYRRMLDSHPGGGYEILRINRTADELISMPRHTKWSKKAHDWVDVEEGISVLRKNHISYFVWSSAGVTYKNSPRLHKFLDEINKYALIKAEYRPHTDTIYTPTIIIYEIPKTL